MPKTCKLFNITAVVGIAMVLLATPLLAVHAQGGEGNITGTPSGTTQGTPAQQQGSENSQRCERISQQVKNIEQKYEDNRNRHVNRYEKIIGLVENLSEKLEDKGYDLSEVNSDLAQLRTMKEQFVQQYNSFANSLQQVSTAGCAEDAQQFKGALSQSRNQLKATRQTSMQMHEYVKNQLRQHLQDLKNQDLD